MYTCTGQILWHVIYISWKLLKTLIWIWEKTNTKNSHTIIISIPGRKIVTKYEIIMYSGNWHIKILILHHYCIFISEGEIHQWKIGFPYAQQILSRGRFWSYIELHWMSRLLYLVCDFSVIFVFFFFCLQTEDINSLLIVLCTIKM